jgi:hypothetical protein
VNRNRADGVVDAQIFEQVDSPDHDDSGADTDEERAFRSNPVTGTGDRDQSGQEPVHRQSEVPFALGFDVGIKERGQAG